jgi:hypothetical protein
MNKKETWDYLVNSNIVKGGMPKGPFNLVQKDLSEQDLSGKPGTAPYFKNAIISTVYM